MNMPTMPGKKQRAKLLYKFALRPSITATKATRENCCVCEQPANAREKYRRSGSKLMHQVCFDRLATVDAI